MNGTELRAKFDSEWGMFRRFISSNPLTGFWVGVVLGAGIILAIGKAVGSLV